MGLFRMATPVLYLWLYGMSLGHGITAWVFSTRLIADWLSPLAFPLYLLHMPMAEYVWYIYRAAQGATFDDSVDVEMIGMSGANPIMLPWWAVLFIVVPVCCILGALYTELLNPYVMPICLRYLRWQIGKSCCAVCCGCCGIEKLPDDDDANDAAPMTTLSRVVATVRTLSGTDCAEQSRLEDLGVDSFGLTALCGALRDAFPDTEATLRPLQVARCNSVGGLAAYIDGAGSS